MSKVTSAENLCHMIFFEVSAQLPIKKITLQVHQETAELKEHEKAS